MENSQLLLTRDKTNTVEFDVLVQGTSPTDTIDVRLVIKHNSELFTFPCRYINNELWSVEIDVPHQLSSDVKHNFHIEVIVSDQYIFKTIRGEIEVRGTVHVTSSTIKTDTLLTSHPIEPETTSDTEVEVINQTQDIEVDVGPVQKNPKYEKFKQVSQLAENRKPKLATPIGKTDPIPTPDTKPVKSIDQIIEDIQLSKEQIKLVEKSDSKHDTILEIFNQLGIDLNQAKQKHRETAIQNILKDIKQKKEKPIVEQVSLLDDVVDNIDTAEIERQLEQQRVNDAVRNIANSFVKTQ